MEIKLKYLIWGDFSINLNFETIFKYQIKKKNLSIKLDIRIKFKYQLRGVKIKIIFYI